MRYPEAIQAGFTPGALRAALRRGLLLRPRRGLLTLDVGTGSGEAPSPAVEGGRESLAEPDWIGGHLAAVRAALASVDSEAVATHESAALLHGLARPGTSRPTHVQLALPGAANYDGPGLRIRGTGVLPHERTVVAGIAVTSLARTAIDLARGRPLASALIPLDSAARLSVARAAGAEGNALRSAVRHGPSREAAVAELRTSLSDCFGWPGTLAVSRALDHVDPAAESAPESRSRGWFIEARIPRLQVGYPIACGATTYWADFCSVGHRVVGEADGWSKYGVTPEQMRVVLEHERTRARALEADGWRIVRWASTDPRDTVITRMSAALA